MLQNQCRSLPPPAAAWTIGDAGATYETQNRTAILDIQLRITTSQVLSSASQVISEESDLYWAFK